MSRKNKLIGAGVVSVCLLVSVREYRRERVLRQMAGRLSAAPCLDFHQARSHVGQNVCITGLVLRAYTSKADNTFLDFCAHYETCPFSTVIFAGDRNKFGNLESLSGREVEIRGLITSFRGRAEIIIHDPWQLQVTR